MMMKATVLGFIGLALAGGSLLALVLSGVITINVEKLSIPNPLQADHGSPGYKCADAAPRLCTGLAEDLRTGRVVKPTKIDPAEYPVELPKATKQSAWDELDTPEESARFDKDMAQRFGLMIYLSEHYEKPLSFDSDVTLQSGACKTLGAVPIKKLGDIYTFFESCTGQIIDDAFRYNLSIQMHFPATIDPEFLSTLEYIYAVKVLTARAPYDYNNARGNFTLHLESPGGDPYAAMAAGDLVFNTFGSISVGKSGCASACVFVLAAGRERGLYPYDSFEEAGAALLEYTEETRDRYNRLVAIHSPFPVSPESRSQSDFSEMRASFASDSRTYFEKFGVSAAVVDLMMSVPSGEARMLTPEELERFHLIGDNILKTEMDRSDIIAKCGVDFDRRLISFNQALEAQCDGSGRGNKRLYYNCVNSLIREFMVTTKDCRDGGQYMIDETGKLIEP